MSAFHFSQGHGPLLISMPHVGTDIPPEVDQYLSEKGRQLTDTDWHLDRLYDFPAAMGVSTLMARHSRTVIDLNRPADGSGLYLGQNETELCPTTAFDNQPLYQEGCAPDGAEIQRRKETYWQPYHDRLRAELDRIKKQYGYALLWDAHSIKSHVPRFFDGQLSDLNLGSGNGLSCSAELAEGLFSIAASAPYSTVLNGRFTGGYITRHYGQPDRNIHAIQLEISQITYMDEAPAVIFREELAARLRPTLKAMIKYLLTAPRHKK